jgi:hypothetical protein
VVTALGSGVEAGAQAAATPLTAAAGAQQEEQLASSVVAGLATVRFGLLLVTTAIVLGEERRHDAPRKQHEAGHDGRD